MTYLDCNCSYGCAARPPHRFAATPHALLAEMDHAGVAGGLVYHTNQRFASPATWNAVVAADISERLPCRGHCCPRSPTHATARPADMRARLLPAWAILPESCGELLPPAELVAAMPEHGVSALYAFPQEHRYRLNGRTFPELFRLMTRHRIPLFAKENLYQLQDLLTDCPDLIVVAVNQGPHSLDRHLRPLMDAFPNLHADTSYLLVEGLIADLCERYGPERLLFGTAFPDNCSGGARRCLEQAAISEEARGLVAGGNLQRLLGWAECARGSASPPSQLLCRRQSCRRSSAAPRTPCPPIIDMHGHWGPFGGSYLPAAPEAKMLAALERAGVRHIVCSAHDALLADPERGNQTMQAAILRSPQLLSGYWAVNPNYPELAARTPQDYAAAKGFVGFKFLPDYHVYPVTGDRYRPALECADAKRLLVLVHTWGGSGFDSPQMLGEVAARYPRVRFLMGHSGYGDWDAAVRVARELPNVWLELTAVYVAHDFAMQPSGSGTPSALISCPQVNGILEYMVEQAGSEKIVFGTDMPWYSPQFAAGAVLGAHITPAAKHNILHRNAERLLGRSHHHDPSDPTDQTDPSDLHPIAKKGRRP